MIYVSGDFVSMIDPDHSLAWSLSVAPPDDDFSSVLLDLMSGQLTGPPCPPITAHAHCHADNSTPSACRSDSIESDEPTAPVDEQALKRLKRKAYFRDYYRKAHPFTPILKRDMRRQLGRMWVNVLNLGDASIFKSFLTQFSAHTCAHRNVFYVSPQLRKFFPTALDTSAIDQSVLHSAYTFATTPDLTCALIDCKIIQSSHEKGSSVVINVHFTGTKLYDVGEPESGTVPQLQQAIEQGRSQETINPTALIPSLPYLDGETIKKMCVPIDPIHVECSGVFVFKLDEQHAMKSFEFHWSNIDLTAETAMISLRPPFAECAPIVFPAANPRPLPAMLVNGLDVSEAMEM